MHEAGRTTDTSIHGTDLMQGGCLCGAVRVGADRHRSGFSYCHCPMCRRWSGSMAACLEAPYDLMPGLFDCARALPLIREVYADKSPFRATLSRDHPRVGATDYEHSTPFVSDGDMP